MPNFCKFLASHFCKPRIWKLPEVLYLFGNLSQPPTWIPTEMPKFCNFFGNPSFKNQNIKTFRGPTPKCYTLKYWPYPLPYNLLTLPFPLTISPKPPTAYPYSPTHLLRLRLYRHQSSFLLNSSSLFAHSKLWKLQPDTTSGFDILVQKSSHNKSWCSDAVVLQGQCSPVFQK